MSTSNNNLLIRNAIQEIALGHSKERIDKASAGIGGVGTARMVRGWVSKIHDNPNDPEYELFGGTIDVTEFMDESSSAEPITYRGVMMSGKFQQSVGFLIVPFLHSDVTILIDAGTEYKYLVDYTHADVVQIKSHNNTVIGVTETEDLDTEDPDAPDYNELKKTGNETETQYYADKIVTVVKGDDGTVFSKETDKFGYKENAGDSSVQFNDKGITHKVGKTEVKVVDGKVEIGSGNNLEPSVKGAQHALLMKDVLLECSQIMTPTLMGTMPPVNVPNFISLISRIDGTLSDNVFIKE